MSLSDITKKSVDLAIAEYDRLGREGFHNKYGFSDARDYWLVYNDRRYPSKAIAAIAHQYVEGRKLGEKGTYTGGEATVVRKLRQLGFSVETPPRNPDWLRDEIILALDLYLANPASPPSKTSAKVTEVSGLLRKLHRLNGTAGKSTLRNTNGVYLKMMNFRSLDPTFLSQGKRGMPSTSDLDELVWEEYIGRRAELASDAKQIRDCIMAADEKLVASLPATDPYEGEEGGVIVRLHKRYERDPKLVARKKSEAMASGNLSCEVCKFDFEQNYGVLGTGYIEVHHINALHQVKGRRRTSLADLAILCANCHRMAHRRRVPLSLNELRKAFARIPD